MKIRKLIPDVVRTFAKRHAGRGAAPPGNEVVLPDFGPARLLSNAPPVFITGIPYDEYLGIAASFARRYGNVAAGFIIFPTWSIERPGCPEAIRRRMLDHSARFPNHKFRFICNTRTEADLLLDVGLPAVFLNKNFTVSEQIFHPLAGVPVEFDAVYNARFVSEKRHELAADIPRVAYVAYMEMTLNDRQRHERQEQFQDLSAAALARNPRHALLNEMADGLPVEMAHKEVNAAFARAAVGLILSEVEGSSYASMEYLLAGLPVVSTPSRGGRDVFFDPEYCIVCAPDPAAVRDAVAALRAKGIPREIVRARTLAKIEPERKRFLALVNDLIEEVGGGRRYSGGAWPFGDVSGITWRPFETHLDRFADASRAHLCAELGLDASTLAGVQLEAAELRPIVAAIKERPGCSLLVFGCGNDSAFWETVNHGGTTAFLEDNPKWAAHARAGLAAATVHVVQYGTRLSNWRRLLDHSRKLTMDLPGEIGARRWDVILVDGPAGYDDALPGRMKSIYAASRLVAPGGWVFVHDCERPAERAFSARYLGDDRLIVEAKGHAVLRGYKF